MNLRVSLYTIAIFVMLVRAGGEIARAGSGAADWVTLLYLALAMLFLYIVLDTINPPKD